MVAASLGCNILTGPVNDDPFNADSGCPTNDCMLAAPQTSVGTDVPPPATQAVKDTVAKATKIPLMILPVLA